jgi:hypothetical protein
MAHESSPNEVRKNAMESVKFCCEFSFTIEFKIREYESAADWNPTASGVIVTQAILHFVAKRLF